MQFADESLLARIPGTFAAGDITSWPDPLSSEPDPLTRWPRSAGRHGESSSTRARIIQSLRSLVDADRLGQPYCFKLELHRVLPVRDPSCPPFIRTVPAL